MGLFVYTPRLSVSPTTTPQSPPYEGGEDKLNWKRGVTDRIIYVSDGEC